MSTVTARVIRDAQCARALADVHAVFRRWLGDEYDLAAIDAVIATAAAEQLEGDPAWLLVISGPGAAKTETIQSLASSGALVTSTISSEGALLSGTPARDKGKDATGGLLRRLGSRGVLVIKDMTSILAMHRDSRSSVLAALREVYDGRWERNIGADGGKSLTWTGRLAVIGAVTTAWDTHHAVTASMGDRFVVLRMDSSVGRQAARERAMFNTGHEDRMRRELADVVKRALAVLNGCPVFLALTAEDYVAIGEAADVVTLCRTAVEFDYRGDVLDAHAPEAPTRFAKQLVQIMRGAMAIGMDRADALRLALRCARDSMPPLRLAILEDLASHPHSRTHDVRARLKKPRMTVDRQLQALHMLGVLTCDEVEISEHKSRWYYSVAEHIDPTVVVAQICHHT
ncbi:MAG: ArsR family transcriptional regulator [Acidobacteria bacterium]|nr:ArsR family transcriptional regulator [Acidobacteriota bacterium]MCA1650792.1 ArsR family transcriptional regulator [Acidobacteriota bacterium]